MFNDIVVAVPEPNVWLDTVAVAVPVKGLVVKLLPHLVATILSSRTPPASGVLMVTEANALKELGSKLIKP